MKIKIFTTPFGHVKYAVTTSQKQQDRLLKQEKKWPRIMSNYRSDCHGVLQFVSRSAGPSYAVMNINANRKQGDAFYAAVVHEAVHLWQSIKQDMEEDKPSEEFEAYSIDLIVQHALSVL